MKGNEILSIQTDGNEGKRKKINGNELKRHQWTRWETTWNEVKGILCTRNLCPGRGGAAGGTRKRENATHGNGKKRKRENAKTAKTRKRRKHNPFRSTLNTNIITDLGMCRYVRQQPSPKHFEHERFHSFGHV